MARRRFAVALLIPPPAAFEIDGLRRALGDRQLGRIDPHVTVIPPINLRDEEVADALAVVQAAAARSSPMALTIGPLETFGEESPVRFLAVRPWEPVVALHEACLDGVLARPEARPFHPHVTVDIAGGTQGEPDPAVDLLRHYEVEVLVDRVTVLEHRRAGEGDERGGPRWEPYLAHRL